MKKYNWAFVLFCFSALGCSFDDSGITMSNELGRKYSHEVSLSDEEVKIELLREENYAPLSYLEMKDLSLYPNQIKIRRGGLFRNDAYEPDGGKIDGYLVNHATMTSYQDIAVKISFYSQSENVLDEQFYTVSQLCEPSSINHFSFRFKSIPPSYADFSLEILGARVVDDNLNP